MANEPLRRLPLLSPAVRYPEPVNPKRLCVCELTHALVLPQPNISHHLGTLHKPELASDRKAVVDVNLVHARGFRSREQVRERMFN